MLSAYFRMGLVLKLGRQSEVIGLSSRGLRTQPWGVPVFRVMTLELFLPPWIDCVLQTGNLATNYTALS